MRQKTFTKVQEYRSLSQDSGSKTASISMSVWRQAGPFTRLSPPHAPGHLGCLRAGQLAWEAVRGICLLSVGGWPWWTWHLYWQSENSHEFVSKSHWFVELKLWICQSFLEEGVTNGISFDGMFWLKSQVYVSLVANLMKTSCMLNSGLGAEESTINI